MSGIAWLRRAGVWARRSAVVSAGACVAIVTPAYGSLPAEGEAGTPSGTSAASCPSSNSPNTLALVAGTPQSATLGSAFATNLQVDLANSDGCPVTAALAGIPVTFSAPSFGASGSFSASGSSTVMVGSDASGMVSAPAFTADDTAGSYTVTASSPYGSVSFSLTNAVGGVGACATVSSVAPSSAPVSASPAGEPAKLTAGIGATQSARVGARFSLRLAVTVTDAEKNPAPGVWVTFAAPARGASGGFTTRSFHGRHSRPHTSLERRVEVRTDACGVALAPPLTANHRQGGYIVVASLEHLRTAFALVNEGP